MKNIILLSIFISLFLSATVLFAQALDPLAGYQPDLRSQEIVVYNNWERSLVYDYLNFPGIGDSLYAFPEITRPDSAGSTIKRHLFMDMCSGNFSGPAYDEVAAAWEGANHSVVLTVSHIDANNKVWTDISVTESDTGVLTPGFDYINLNDLDIIRLVSGNFDTDKQDEFILSYLAADSTIKMTLYDFDETEIIQAKSTIADQQFSYQYEQDQYYDVQYKGFIWYDLAAADFNSDGIDEVVLTGYEKDTDSAWHIYVKVYEIDSLTSQFVPRVKETAFHSSELQEDFEQPILDRLLVTTGNFSSVEKNEGVIGFYSCDLKNYQASQQKIMGYLMGFRISHDPWELNFGEQHDFVYKDENSGSPLRYNESPFCVASGDINDDGLDEVFTIQKETGVAHSYKNCLKIYRADSTLHFTEVFEKILAGNDGRTPPHKHILEISNIDYDSTCVNRSNEIIVLENLTCPFPYNFYHYRIAAYSVNTDSTGNIQELSLLKRADETSPNQGISQQKWPRIITGDFDEKVVRLGRPARYSRSQILQPLIVLNAPPIHYDIFDDVAYDVSECYPPNEPAFYTAYNKEITSVVGVETTISSEWSTSVNIGVSAVIDMFSIGADMTQRWGEKFSKVVGSSRTIRISVDKTAVIDDYIYATMVNYDFWEYPVYLAESLIGYILVTQPVHIEHTWFPSKMPSASDWIPNHEVGNIFSYQEYPELNDNNEVKALIRGSYENSYVLADQGEVNWELTFSDFNESNESSTISMNEEYSGGLSFGIGLELKGNYSEEEISTHRVSVTKDLSLKSHLATLDFGIGQVYYKVTPYAYWARYGALVLDYAVKPDLSEFDQLWWQIHYGQKPDPAFILPWKYDPEKGITLDDPTWRQKTKEIVFYPIECVHGDTVTIMTRIHNYSLLPTFDPVTVRFYVGDPDNGGTLIVGTAGETEVVTDTQILARGQKIVQMDWIIPPDLEQYPRIYAVLDPDNAIDEIHENNNKGWSVLRQTRIVGSIDGKKQNIPDTYSLFQNYPNPFNPSTTIKFNLPKTEFTTLKIYNIMGQEVAKLVSDRLNAGNYKYEWDAGRMASGIYFYVLRAGEYYKVKKMVLLR